MYFPSISSISIIVVLVLVVMLLDFDFESLHCCGTYGSQLTRAHTFNQGGVAILLNLCTTKGISTPPRGREVMQLQVCI